MDTLIFIGLVTPVENVEEWCEENKEKLRGVYRELRIQVNSGSGLCHIPEDAGKILKYLRPLGRHFPEIEFDVCLYDEKTLLVYRVQGEKVEMTVKEKTQSEKREVGTVKYRLLTQPASPSVPREITPFFRWFEKEPNDSSSSEDEEPPARPPPRVTGRCPYIFVRGLRKGEECQAPCFDGASHCPIHARRVLHSAPPAPSPQPSIRVSLLGPDLFHEQTHGFVLFRAMDKPEEEISVIGILGRNRVFRPYHSLTDSEKGLVPGDVVPGVPTEEQIAFLKKEGYRVNPEGQTPEIHRFLVEEPRIMGPPAFPTTGPAQE